MCDVFWLSAGFLPHSWILSQVYFCIAHAYIFCLVLHLDVLRISQSCVLSYLVLSPNIPAYSTSISVVQISVYVRVAVNLLEYCISIRPVHRHNFTTLPTCDHDHSNVPFLWTSTRHQSYAYEYDLYSLRHPCQWNCGQVPVVVP